MKRRLYWLWLDLQDGESRIGFCNDRTLVDRLVIWIQGKTWGLYCEPRKLRFTFARGLNTADPNDVETWSF